MQHRKKNEKIYTWEKVCLGAGILIVSSLILIWMYWLLRILDKKEMEKPEKYENRAKHKGNRNSQWNPAILLICYNRPKYLQKTLKSLTEVTGWSQYPVYISQDGDDAETQNVAQTWITLVNSQKKAWLEGKALDKDAIVMLDRKNLEMAGKSGKRQRLAEKPGISSEWKHWNRERIPQLYEGQAANAWLSQHYEYAIARVFGESSQNHSHIIIIEDDMLFSRDFLRLFESTAWLLDVDHTLWCVSSWNDNGQEEFGWKDERLFRNGFFPGLGWMLTRFLWEEELVQNWPKVHWDHWMRANANGRDCICPEMPRNHNIGIDGAHMDQKMFTTHFQNILFYDEDLSNPSDFGDLDYLLYPNYQAYVRALIHSKDSYVHTGHVRFIPWKDIRPDQVVILPYQAGEFREIAAHLHIWPTPRNHFELITILPLRAPQKTLVILVHRRLSPAWAFPSPDLRILPDPSFVKIVSSSPNIDCSKACSSLGLTCLSDHFDYINNCSVLQENFPCRTCHMEWAPDTRRNPCYISNPAARRHSICMVTDDLPTCYFSHPDAIRLCPCGIKQ